jgi:hypothetical protein
MLRGPHRTERPGIPEAGKLFVYALGYCGLLLAIFAVTAALLFVAFAYSSGYALSQDNQQWLQSWIPTTCCVTNRCCFEVEPGTVESLGDSRWLIVASGQIVTQTGWSRDNRFWRCACDQDPNTRQWIVHAKANTRCLFPPRPMM